jgi:hypothetical protein
VVIDNPDARALPTRKSTLLDKEQLINMKIRGFSQCGNRSVRWMIRSSSGEKTSIFRPLLPSVAFSAS